MNEPWLNAPVVEEKDEPWLNAPVVQEGREPWLNAPVVGEGNEPWMSAPVVGEKGPSRRERREVAEREGREVRAAERAALSKERGAGQLLEDLVQERPEGVRPAAEAVGLAKREERVARTQRHLEVPVLERRLDQAKSVPAGAIEGVAQTVRGGGVVAEVGAQISDNVQNTRTAFPGTPVPEGWELVERGYYEPNRSEYSRGRQDDEYRPDVWRRVGADERREERGNLAQKGMAVAQGIEEHWMGPGGRFELDPRLDDSYWNRALPKGVGSMANSIATHALGGTYLNVLSAGLGGVGGMYQDAVAHGLPEDEAVFVSLLGAPGGAANVLPVGNMFKRMNQASGGGISKVLSTMARHGLAGARDELFQSQASLMLNNFVAQQIYDEGRGVLEGSWETAKVSLGAGFVSGGAMTGFALARNSLLSTLGAAGAEGELIDRANAELAEWEADLASQFESPAAFAEWKAMTLEAAKAELLEQAGPEGSLKRAFHEAEALERGMDLMDYLQAREEMQAAEEVDRQVELGQDLDRRGAAEAFDAEVRGAGEAVDITGTVRGVPVGERVEARSPEAIAWRDRADEGFEQGVSAARNRLLKKSLWDLGEQDAAGLFQGNLLEKKFQKGGRWGLKKDVLPDEVWERIPKKFKNESNGLRFDEAIGLLDQSVGQFNQSVKQYEQEGMLGLPVQREDQFEFVVDLLNRSKEQMIQGELEMEVENLARMPARVNREMLLDMPNDELMRRVQGLFEGQDPGFTVRVNDLQQGDVVVKDGKGYQVIEAGRVKYLRDGEIIEISGDRQIDVEVAVPVGHAMHGQALAAFEVQEAAEGQGDVSVPMVGTEAGAVSDGRNDAGAKAWTHPMLKIADDPRYSDMVDEKDLTWYRAKEARVNEGLRMFPGNSPAAFVSEDGKHGVIIHKSTREPGKWQRSFYDERGFIGDITFDTKLDAIVDAAGDMVPTMSPPLDQWQVQDTFHDGRGMFQATGAVPTIGTEAGAVSDGRNDAGFGLEAVTEADLVAEQEAAARAKQREQMQERQQAPLRGDSRDVGQGQLFDDPNSGGQQDLLGGLTAEAQAARVTHKADQTGEKFEGKFASMNRADSIVGNNGRLKTGESFTASLFRGEGEGNVVGGRGEDSVLGPALYAALSERDAQEYGDVKSVVVSLNNPLVLESDADLKNVSKLYELALASFNGENTTALKAQALAALKAAGYDGVVVQFPIGDSSFNETGRLKILKALFDVPQVVKFAEAQAAQAAMRGRGDSRREGQAGLPLRAEWVSAPAEGRAGKTLVQGVERRDHRGLGLADIVAFVNGAVGVDMRFSKSQTSRKFPAEYRTRNHVAFTRRSQSDINFHEAGHGLLELLRMKAPKVLEAYEGLLVGVAQMPGSLASAENMHEGMAEWVRRRVVEPQSVEQLAVTREIERVMNEYLPEMNGMLKDAARAYDRFARLPAELRWERFNQQARKRADFPEMVRQVVLMGDNALDGMASGNPVSRLDRRIARAIIRDRKDIGASYLAAQRIMRNARRATRDLIGAHNMVLQIGAEAQMAFSGRGEGRGISYVNRQGERETIYRQTWQEIVRKVPDSKWHQFEEAGWALETLNRLKQDNMDYPGRRSGLMSVADLEGVVAKAERDIPNFRHYFDEVQSYFDALLELQRRAGFIGKEEMQRIQRREMYWPMPRELVGEGVALSARTGADVQSGLQRAFGSEEAILDLNQAAEQRTRQVMSSVYWNDFGRLAVENLLRLQGDKSLPAEARIMAGQVFTPMRMKQQKVAAVSREDIQAWVYESWIEMMAQESGRTVEELQAEGFTRDSLNLAFDFKDIYRAKKPGDTNVMSLIVDGERQFYQVNEDSLFLMFAKPESMSNMMRAVKWATGPLMQNWKRGITTSLPFSVANLAGDIINQMMMNSEAVGWVPGGATTLGLWNKFSKKYNVAQEGLLLSRVQPSRTELLNDLKHNAVMRFLTEGFYVSQHKNPGVRLMATALQPSNWLFPIWKLTDVVNLVTGGRALAPMLESATREGAAVAVKMRGGTDRDAALAYWQVTGPFNEHSGDPNVQAAMSMPGFFNPMVQATRRAGQLLTDPDISVSGAAWAKVLVVIPGIFTAMAAARYAMMTEEDKERERNRPIDDRLNYHDVMGFRVRFPWGVEGSVSAFAYNAVMDDLLERKPADARRMSLSLLKRVGDPGTPLQFLGPQLNTLNEAKMNWSNFRQQHITAPWMQGLPASEQYSANTPDFYVKLGRWMDYSPAKLQYIVQQATSRQLDETIRLLDNVQGGKPVQERADLPFVGRMFIREPLGWSSAPVQEVSDVEQKLRLLDTRLNSMGYGWVRQVPVEGITDPNLYALRVQLDQLELLRVGVRQMPRLNGVAQVFRSGEQWAEERNMQQVMVQYAQALMANNPDAVQRIDQAIDLLEEIPVAPPELRQADMIRRRF